MNSSGRKVNIKLEIYIMAALIDICLHTGI